MQAQTHAVHATAASAFERLSMADHPGTRTSADQASRGAPAARRVCGLFHEPGRLEEAVSWLEGWLFVCADMSVVRERRHESEKAASEAPGAAVAESDERVVRAFDADFAGVLAGFGTAGVAVLTGSAATAAVAAAALAGGGAAALGDPPDRDAAPGGRAKMGRTAHPEGAILAVRADRPYEVERAEEVLRIAGAVRIWTQDQPGGLTP